MVTAESAALSTRPAVLLDVDGVFKINAEGKTPEHVVHPAHKWDVYNPKHGLWLNAIRESADIYYISDLVMFSHELIGQHLDVPQFDWINVYDYPGRLAVQRSRAITALLGKRAVAWIDDCITANEEGWAQQRIASGAPTLLISPDRTRGLQPEHQTGVENWLQQQINH